MQSIHPNENRQILSASHPAERAAAGHFAASLVGFQVLSVDRISYEKTSAATDINTSLCAIAAAANALNGYTSVDRKKAYAAMLDPIIEGCFQLFQVEATKGLENLIRNYRQFNQFADETFMSMDYCLLAPLAERSHWCLLTGSSKTGFEQAMQNANRNEENPWILTKEDIAASPDGAILKPLYFARACNKINREGERLPSAYLLEKNGYSNQAFDSIRQAMLRVSLG